MLGNFDIDEDSELTVAEQLGAALKANAGRVIDLFRGWDTDGDGEVSRKEFHKAVRALEFDDDPRCGPHRLMGPHRSRAPTAVW